MNELVPQGLSMVHLLFENLSFRKSGVCGYKGLKLESIMTEAPKAHRIQQYLTELLPTRTPSDKTVMMWRLEIEFMLLF